LRPASLYEILTYGILMATCTTAQVTPLPNGRMVPCSTTTSPDLDANRKLRGCRLASDERFSIIIGSKMIADVPCASDEMVQFDSRSNIQSCTLSADRTFANYYADNATGARANTQLEIRCQAGGPVRFASNGNVAYCLLASNWQFTNRFAGGRTQVVSCRAGGSLEIDGAGNVVCIGGGPVVPPVVNGGTGGKGGTVNLALASRGAVATQSSVYGGSCPAGPQYAIDGVTDAGIAYHCRTPISHTNNENRPWWQVDLGAVYTLNQIVIWNRNDVAKERLSNFRVTVKDAQNAPAYTRDFFTSGGYPDLSLSIPLGNVTGRIVHLQLLGSNYLNVAEVQVFGQADASNGHSGSSGSRFSAVYTGTFQNTIGGRGQAKLVIEENNGSVQGSWDGDQFSGTRTGNVLTFKLSNIENGCRDYQVRVDFAADGATAKVNYQVNDRCRQPATYSGTELLSRE
jgi:hypothetical protein